MYLPRDLRPLLTTLFHITSSELKRQHQGTLLGSAWPVLQPAIMAITLIVIFQYGVRVSTPQGGTNFAAWLVAGLFPWYYIASNLTSGCQALSANAFLVKKVAFELRLLPLARCLAPLPTHAVLITGAAILCTLSGYGPSWYWLQIPLYVFLLILLTSGIAFATSSIMLFSRDIANVTAIFTQIGFWLTPIFWDPKNIATDKQWLLNLNPAHFIVNGYRDALLSRAWIWENPLALSVFLTVSGLMLTIGLLTFKRLRPQFGDVV